MNDIVNIAAAILSRSENRLEIAAGNISGMSHPGHKSQAIFSEMIDATSALSAKSNIQEPATDLSQGKLSETGNALDMAISGAGFFEITGNNETYLTRNGQFVIGPDGRVMTSQGYILQQTNGNDVVLQSASAEILQNGIILENGRPVGKISIVDVIDPNRLKHLGGSLFHSGQGNTSQVDAPLVRQGMIETSNVTLSNEMMNMMEAIRQAETGARLVQTYDTLLGQAIATFGGN